MKRIVSYILVCVLLVGIFSACHDSEVLETYEEVKKEVQQNEPISFDAYITSSVEDNATTRANLSYLTALSSNDVGGTHALKYIPCLGLSLGNSGAYGGPSGATGKRPYVVYERDFRHGWTALNSYIVGVYGFAHNNDDWSTVVSNNSAVANLMTNQPLLHVPVMRANGVIEYTQDDMADKTLWDYEPKKYWPNDKNSKVTFIAYYPFQDYVGGYYYRDGNEMIRNESVVLSGITYEAKYINSLYDNDPHQEADLTCIKPPLATNLDGSKVTGSPAYTFSFQQKNNVEEHIDFMMGLTQVSDERSSGNQVTLNLRHTLCAVEFSFAVETNTTKWGQLTGQSLPEEIEIKVNSIGFEGLYTQGDVTPNSDNTFNWFNLDNYDGDGNTYMVTFEDNTNGSARLPWIRAGEDDRPTFNYDGSSWTYTNDTPQLIYNKEPNESALYNFYGRNSRGFRYLLLVIPQKAQLEEDNTTVKKSYLVVNYDFKYKISDDDDYVIYKNCIEKVELLDAKKDKNKTQLFCAGKMLVFHVRFSPLGINMDAELMDWDEGEGPVEEGGNGVPVPHEWEDQMDREEETP